MKTSEEIAAQALVFSRDEYFQDLDAQLAAREVQLLSEDGFFGLALSAPARIELARDGELPIVLAMRQSGLRAWEVGRDRNVVLAAVNLDTRVVTVGRPFRDRKDEEYAPREALERPPRPDGPSAESVGVGVRKIDARAVLDLPWKPARYRLAAIAYDWISNVVDVELRGDAPPASGTARAVYPLPPAPPDDRATLPTTLPSYLPAGELATPPLALGLGADPGRGSAFGAWGALEAIADVAHLPRTPTEIVEADGVARPVAAVVPLTLALAMLDGGRPFLASIAVPVYGPPASPGDPLVAHFAVDLPDALRHGLPRGSYRVWAFLEGAILGPWSADY